MPRDEIRELIDNFLAKAAFVAPEEWERSRTERINGLLDQIEAVVDRDIPRPSGPMYDEMIEVR